MSTSPVPAKSPKAAPAKSPAPAPRRAPAARPKSAATAKKKPSKGQELFMYSLSALLLGGIGYIGWRTQVKGESIEAVLPFLASSKSAADAAGAEGTAADGGSAGLAEPTGGSSKSSPQNTVFGRRTGSAPTRDFGYRPE